MSTTTAAAQTTRFSFKQRVIAPLALAAALSFGVTAAASAAHYGGASTVVGTVTAASAAPGATIAASVAESVSETSVVAGRSRNA